MEEHYVIYKETTSEYEVAEKVHQKKKHLVVPIVMMVEGVHNGSRGPILHPIEDLGKFPQAWNGIPVVIDHPQVNEDFVSANDPDIIDNRSVGRIYNTKVDGLKLRAQAWIEEEKLKTLSMAVLIALQEKEPIEVSVGVFTEEEDEEGEYKGENYKAIARNHRPDHLALLPGGVGACSIKDGCGIRANKKGGNNVNKELLDAMRLLNKDGFAISKLNANDVNEDGYREVMEAAQQAIYAMDSQSAWYYIEDLFDSYVVYGIRLQVGGSQLYKQDYTYTDGEFKLTGSPVEVRKKVDIEYVTNSFERTKSSNNNKNKEVTIMAEKEKCPKCLVKIDALIANEQSKFIEADREFLLTLNESQLDKLAPVMVDKIVEKIVEKPIEVNKLTPEQIADLAFVANQRTERKREMIQGIQTNTSKELWPDEVLNVMNEDHLKRLFDSVKKEAPVDYSFGGVRPIEANAVTVEALYPTGVVIEEPKK